MTVVHHSLVVKARCHLERGFYFFKCYVYKKHVSKNGASSIDGRFLNGERVLLLKDVHAHLVPEPHV